MGAKDTLKKVQNALKMITIKKPDEIAKLREGGRRLAAILRILAEAAKPGVSAKELDILALELAEKGGDKSAFLGYQPDSADFPYPGSICVSINNEIVHGFPSAEKIFKEGDVVAIDMGLIHRNLITDSAVTVIVGKGDEKAKKLVKATRQALEKGISAARAGAHIGDIGYAIESFVRPLGFGLAEELAGHGVGYFVHEDPYIPNTGRKGEGDILKPGMVIAIEPMLNEGTGKVTFDNDGYTVRTKDGSRSAHFEHTVAITENGPLILTEE